MNASFSLNQIVGFVLGSWGCLGVGCFFLLSAYFTVGKSRFKTLKISKIIFQTIFWSFAMFFLYLLAKVVSGSKIGFLLLFSGVAKALISPFLGSYWFITAYIFLYVLAPYLDKVISSLSIGTYGKLITILTLLLPVYGTIHLSSITCSDLAIAVYWYLLWGYLRQKPNNFLERNARKYLLVSMLSVVALEIASSVFCTKFGVLTKGVENLIGRFSIFQVVAALSLFYIFKNMDIGTSKFVNFVAKGVLGVYLIHQNKWFIGYLWNNICKLDYWYKSSWAFGLVLLLSSLIVFVISTVLDLGRLYLLEKISGHINIPFLEKVARKLDKMINPTN